MARKNLVVLASEIASEEGLSRSIGGTPQVLELLGIIGKRWRNMPMHKVLREVACIAERAGKRSSHKEKS